MLSRAERLIQQADIQAEALIGLVRIAVALILLVTIFMVRTQVEGPPEFGRLRAALGLAVILVWLGLGFASLLVVQYGLYRPWMAWAFGIIDVLAITTNLSLGFLFGGISPMMVLASPAAILICVLFVLQSLRFRVRLQLYLSFSLLAFISVLTFTPDTHIPLASLQEAALLEFGVVPNLVRIVLLAIVGGITTFAVWRAYRLLYRVAHETELRMNQTRFLPSELATSMTDADMVRLKQGRKVHLAIMFADIRGFTALSDRMNPEDVATFLSTFRGHVTSAAALHGGIVDKFIGDGALVLFGLDSAPDAAARNAVAAGQALLTYIDDWNRERVRSDDPALRIAIALHAGDVVAGAIGDERRLEFSIVGAPVNEASRIETLAKDRNLAMAASAAIVDRLENPQAAWTDLGAEQLRGASTPVRIFGFKNQEPRTIQSGHNG